MGFQQLIAQPALAFSSYSQNRDLVVLDRFGSCEAVNPQVFEMLGQSPRTSCELSLRDDEEEDTTGHEPSPCVPQKYNFHPLVVGFPHFKVVGWVEIDECQTVYPALHFQCVAVDYLNPKSAGLLGSVGIKFNAIRQGRGIGQDRVKRCAVSNTRVKSGERFCWKDKLGSESPGFNLGQWVKAELQSAYVSDTNLHAANNRAAALRLRERIFWQRARFWKNL